MRTHQFQSTFIGKLFFSIPIIAFLLLFAGCNTTTKLGAESNRLIGRNLAILSAPPAQLYRVVQVQQVSSGSLAADLIINAVSRGVRANGKTAEKTNRILSPSFDPGAQLSSEISKFLESKYKVQKYPAISGTVKKTKGNKWPNPERVASVAALARSQGFDGVVLDFVATNFKAESAGSSINKSGGHVLLSFGGNLALIDSKTDKVMASGSCLASGGADVKLDNIISLPAANTVVAEAPSSNDLVDLNGDDANEVGTVAAPAPAEPNQQFVNSQFAVRVTACANRIIQDALL